MIFTMGPISGLFRILAIIIFAILGVLILGMGILIIFPSFNIFGYHYVNLDDQQRTSLDVSSNMFSSADIIRFETGRFDIHLIETDETKLFTDNSDINVIATRALTGFVRGNVEEPVLVAPKLVQEDGKQVAVIQMAEPDGLIFDSGMSFDVYVNKSTLGAKDVDVVTKGGDVYLGNVCKFSDEEQTDLTSPVLRLGSLNVKADSGAVYLRSIDVARNIEITKKSGDIASYINLPNNLTISITDGLGKINLRNVGSEGAVKELFLKHVANSHIKLNSVYGDMIMSAGAGLLDMSSVFGEMEVTSNACNIKMETVSAGLTIKGSDGHVDIDRVLGEVNITQANGSVALDEVGDIVYIKTNGGNVSLPNLRTDAEIITHNGNINIKCTLECDIKIRSHSGATTIEDLRGAIDFSATDRGTAKLDVVFDSIIGISKIYTESGNVSVTIPVNTNSYLSWSTAKSADIQVYSHQSKDREGKIFFDTSTNPLEYTNQINIVSAVGHILVKRS